MTTTDEENLTVKAILDTLEVAHEAEEPVAAEGLRDRKKRRLRQRISNVATALFMVEGFDNVSVARIAAACEVSEQTVFNYFPTKESMFFDRTDSSADALAEAVRHPGAGPLGEVLLNALFGAIGVDRWDGMDEAIALRLFRRFCAVAVSSPALREAPYAELERFTATVGASLAERIGVDPGDPEVELTAIVIAGLARANTQATFRHVQHAPSFAALERSVRADVIRALRIATPTLDAFDNLGTRLRRPDRR
jgi:AcrR family transcriptional regulator